MSPVRRSALKRRLDALVATADYGAYRAADPVSFVHAYADPADQEIVGLVAALLAFGQVVSVRRSVARVLDALGPAPSRAAQERPLDALDSALAGFVHRVYRGGDVARMVHAAGALQRTHGSLGARFAMDLGDADGDLREGLARFADALRVERPARGLRHLVPDPRAGSACKRLLLYLRWVVRPADGVDLGLWAVPPSALLVPVDTHVHRIARNLELTARNDASWRTAEEITASLRALDPHDPVRYDFALCHLGVSRRCPSRRDADKCDACALRPVCGVWRVAPSRRAREFSTGC